MTMQATTPGMPAAVLREMGAAIRLLPWWARPLDWLPAVRRSRLRARVALRWGHDPLAGVPWSPAPPGAPRP